jgi:hypothetical protein
MRRAIRCALLTSAAASLAACGAGAGGAATPDSTMSAGRPDSQSTPDSIPEERPDTIRPAPVDSATMLLSLLPPAPRAELGGEARALGERAVFVPRTQRWFIARAVDSLLAMDIGRLDGGIGTGDAAQATFDRMVAALSPIGPGMVFTAHTARGAVTTKVAGYRLTGRRIVAVLDLPPPFNDEPPVPVEWRGAPAKPVRVTAPTRCAPGDTGAIDATIARYAPADSQTLSVVRGCFGAFRALIAIRPRSITPESIEKVVLVRESGGARSGRLRDLSYPLHELRSTVDIDGDGTDEIVVHSFRPAMETWAALRMTDSVTFTRFASGFTVEKR